MIRLISNSEIHNPYTAPTTNDSDPDSEERQGKGRPLLLAVILIGAAIVIAMLRGLFVNVLFSA